MNASREQHLRERFARGIPEELAGLAQDPDLPLDLLQALAEHHPTQAASNPLWPLLLAASPGILSDFPPAGLRAMLDCLAGAWLLPLGAASADPQVRAEAARSSLLSPELIEQLSLDPEPWVRVRIADNPSTPPSILERLAQHESSEVRNRVATNPNTPLATLRILLDAPEYEVFQGVSLNPRMPLEWLYTLASSEDENRRATAADHRSAPVDILVALADDPGVNVRMLVAFNRATPAQAVARLLSDPAIEVRQYAAGHEAAPAELLLPLVDDPDKRIRVALARNPSLPLEAASKLAEQSRDVQHALLSNRSLHRDFFTLERLARVGTKNALRKLASNAELSPELLGRLCQHPDPGVRQRAASNPSSPPEQLARLAAEGSPQERAAALANPSTPRLLARRRRAPGARSGACKSKAARALAGSPAPMAQWMRLPVRGRPARCRTKRVSRSRSCADRSPSKRGMWPSRAGDIDTGR